MRPLLQPSTHQLFVPTNLNRPANITGTTHHHLLTHQTPLHAPSLQIERIDDSTFRCFVGKLAFLGFSVEPVITVSVVVEERGCTIKLLSAKLQGSKLVEDVNSKFTAQMTNVVRWSATEDAAVKQISSSTSIEVVVQVPGWAGLIPVPSMEATGSKVMQTTLNLMVPRFLQQLGQDYALWASGDESRKPLDNGGL